MTAGATGSAADGGYEAVLFDALGTLVELVPPWPPLGAALASHGIELDEAVAKEAMVAEMTYYKAHHMEGRDKASLSELRGRCTAVLREHLPAAVDSVPDETLTEILLGSLQFRPYPDAAPLLGRLRLLGMRTAVVSNWDVSLRGVLGELGLGGLVNEIVVSAEAGVAKPAAGIFELALQRLRRPAGKAVFVGDSPDTDIAGAAGAGMRPVLIDRFGTAGDDLPPEVERISTLEGLDALVAPPSLPSQR